MADGPFAPGVATAAPGARTGTGTEPVHGAAEGPGDEPVRVFVYGTLQPGGEAWHLVAPHACSVDRASVRGVLWDTGLGYPALTLDAHGSAPVPGAVVELDPDHAAQALEELDAYEGVGVGSYERRRVDLIDGRSVWTYVWMASVAGSRRVARWPLGDQNP